MLKGSMKFAFKRKADLAHQIVLLFTKQPFCSHDDLGCFVPSSWHPSSPSPLFIPSRCSRLSLSCRAPGEGLRACSSCGQRWMLLDAVFSSVRVREGWHWKDAC